MTTPQRATFPSFRLLLFALVFTFSAIALDQLLAPALRTSTPLWAVFALFLLFWRRGPSVWGTSELPNSPRFSVWRVLLFFAAHAGLVLAASNAPGPLSDPRHAWVRTLLKLLVLVPTLSLFSLREWKDFLASYKPEFVAALVVLFTFFPLRVIGAVWPWYGQVLGRFVYSIARPLVPSLGYVNALFPTITGPDLDVTVILDCSGFNGVQLFDYLFGLVAVCDWNRLQKGRTLLAYFLGILAMLLGNALRITAMVVFGNHGFSEQVRRFHLSAGWLFFSVTFLVYLVFVYRWMLAYSSRKESAA